MPRRGDRIPDGTAARWTRTSRIIKARPEALYAAFMDRAALVRFVELMSPRGVVDAVSSSAGSSST